MAVKSDSAAAMKFALSNRAEPSKHVQLADDLHRNVLHQVVHIDGAGPVSQHDGGDPSPVPLPELFLSGPITLPAATAGININAAMVTQTRISLLLRSPFR